MAEEEKKPEDGEAAKAAWARYQSEGGSSGEKARSEAAQKQQKKKSEVELPAGDHSVFKPGEAGDPGDKGVEGYTQMPYDYR